MGSTFNPQILVEKLAKLNSSQQSIETLSHWCIFHMNKAKQVVETWDRQFHCSPREQRLAYLYLANDILQNSRRKGIEFVTEFWKVLPGALRNVTENGDEAGKNAALRLINIWEERKVFGSRGQILKEEFMKRQLENGNLKHAGFKLRPHSGNALDKLASGYQAVYGNQLDEDTILSKCRNAISFVEKVDKDIEGDHRLDELKGQDAILKDCIEKLSVVESSRANLVAVLREALQEQEHKLDQVRDQLQAARSRSEQADSFCRQLVSGHVHGQTLADQNRNGSSTSVIYTRQTASAAEKSSHIEEDSKSAAAAVAAKLAASTSSAQMLTSVLSSLASSGIMTNPAKDSSSNDYPPEKRVKKIEKDQPYIPAAQTPPIMSEELNPGESPPPLPPSSPPPPPPLPPPMQPYQVPQYMQTAMQTIQSGPYMYSMIQPPQSQIPSYSPVGPPLMNGVVSTFTPPPPVPPPNPYQSYPTDGGFYSSMPMAPMGRQ